MAKTRAKQVLRDENGRLLPGSTANPNGRPKTALISQALKEILEQQGAKKYAFKLNTIAMTAKRDSDKLAALKEIADRTEGKPTQSMVVGHTIDESSVRLIAELMEKLEKHETVQAALPESDE